jgi:signal recognition particle subunit SEC65
MVNHGDKNMITKDDLNEKDMIDAINELEVLYRVHKDYVYRNDTDMQEDVMIGVVEGKKEMLADIKKILDSLKINYKKPELVK